MTASGAMVAASADGQRPASRVGGIAETARMATPKKRRPIERGPILHQPEQQRRHGEEAGPGKAGPPTVSRARRHDQQEERQGKPRPRHRRTGIGQMCHKVGARHHQQEEHQQHRPRWRTPPRASAAARPWARIAGRPGRLPAKPPRCTGRVVTEKFRSGHGPPRQRTTARARGSSWFQPPGAALRNHFRQHAIAARSAWMRSRPVRSP
jgi:hypothetical protein